MVVIITKSIQINSILSVFTVNLLAIAVGNAYAWSSTVLIALKSDDSSINPVGRPVTTFEESWITSLISLGASVGCFLSAYCSDKIGRKKTFLIFAIPMLLSHLLLAFASTVEEFFIARFMMGLGAGSIYTVVPIYVGEISETNIRGFLGCFMGVFSSVGYLMVYLLGPFVSVKSLSFILMVPIVMFLVLFSLWLQESPYYHIANSDPTAAELSLSKLRTKDSNTIHKELAIIRETIEECKSDESFIGKLKCKSFRKGIIITVTMMIFQQFIGITIILSYMQPIFAASGSSLPSSASTIFVSLVQLISVLVSSSLVDKLGRKKLLMFASSGCTLPLFMLGVFFYLKNEGKDVSCLWWLPVCSLIAYMVAYSWGLGSVIWALVGELFSTKTKALASSLTAFTCLFLSFFMALIFPTLEDLIGYHGTFWFFSCNGLICCFFVFFFVPETKGKSFQEIKILLEQ